LILAIGAFALYAQKAHILLSIQMDEVEKALEKNYPEKLKKLNKKTTYKPCGATANQGKFTFTTPT